jgi:DNA-binding transcriptional LysR family regulator
MDVVDSLRVFVRVAERGSFSATAAELGIGQPSVSKRVAALEARLGATLFKRNTRGLSLTEEGRRAYEHGLRVLESFDTLLEEKGDTGGRRRRIRVACPQAMGTLRLVPMMKDFSRQHPGVEVELLFSDRFVDLVEDGVDVALRFGALADSRYVARRLGWLPRTIVGSPAYFKRHPVPRTPEELAAHSCIVSGRQEVWKLTSPKRTVSVRVGGPLRVDSFLALRQAILSGLGLGLAGAVLFDRSDRVQRVLPDFELAPLPFHMIFNKERFLPSRVRAFIDHFAARLPEQPWLREEPQPAARAR